MSRRRGHLTYANVAVTLALFVVLGGTALALATNSVGSRQIKPGAVKRSDLGRGAVTGSKVVNASLNRGEFAQGELPFARFWLRRGPDEAGDLRPPDEFLRIRGLSLEVGCVLDTDYFGSVLARGPVGSQLSVSGIAGGSSFARNLTLSSSAQPIVSSADSDADSAYLHGIYRNGETMASFEVSLHVDDNCFVDGSALASP